jgi:hypothetical protein
MADRTPNLDLPYILPSQAQKHVTHNEALQVLDGLVNASIVGEDISPPSSPQEGDLWLIGSPAVDEWNGKEGMLALRIDGAWIYLTPAAGWRAWFDSEQQIKLFDGSQWINPLSTGHLDRLGIGTAPDDINRLVLSSEASLFTHAGTSHRMKLNKATAGDTASLLFQSAWSGRAEMGLLGTDALQFKVSPDGSAWTVGLEIDGSGIVRTPQKPLVSATLEQGTINPASGSAIGFDTLALSSGFALGAALASGFGSSLLVSADGLYAISLTANIAATGAFALTCQVNGSSVPLFVSSAATTSAAQTWHASGIVSLSAGDTLSLKSTGTVTLTTGAGNIGLHATLL